MSKTFPLHRLRLLAAAFLLAGWWWVAPAAALAQAPPPAGEQPILNLNAQVTIPGSYPKEQQIFQAGQPTKVTPDLLGKYVVAIYRFGILLSIFLTIFMMMVGGFLWVVAGGSPQRVENAKSYITSALTGLVLALTSFLLLQTVNPSLVVFPPITAQRPDLVQPSGLVRRVDENYGCEKLLVADNPNECEKKCVGFGGGGAYLDQSRNPVAVPIPRSSRFCCACKNKPCKAALQGCSLTDEQGCCKPMICNTVGSDECESLHEGGEEYRAEIECNRDYECLSKMCYDVSGSVYDYCVPDGGFTTVGHRCNSDRECAKGMGCWSEGYSVCAAGFGGGVTTCPNPIACWKFKAGGVACKENRECLSGVCDTARSGQCIGIE